MRAPVAQLRNGMGRQCDHPLRPPAGNRFIRDPEQPGLEIDIGDVFKGCVNRPVPRGHFQKLERVESIALMGLGDLRDPARAALMTVSVDLFAQCAIGLCEGLLRDPLP